jgi:hypothetical protein
MTTLDGARGAAPPDQLRAVRNCAHQLHLLDYDPNAAAAKRNGPNLGGAAAPS